MPLGATDVIFQCPASAMSLMEIGMIRGALDAKTDEGARFIEDLVLRAHQTVLERIQAFLGESVGVHGTMGNPVIVSDAIRKVEEEVGKALLRTLNPLKIFMPPCNDDEAPKRAFADYLYRFTEWGAAGSWDAISYRSLKQSAAAHH